MRRNFALFANVRPLRAWPQLDPLIPDLDITILRENTEGFYPDRKSRLGLWRVQADRGFRALAGVITAPACDRFARFTFEYAAAANVDRLAVIQKRTALPQTEGLFIDEFGAAPRISEHSAGAGSHRSPRPPPVPARRHHRSLWRHPVRPGLRARRRCRYCPSLNAGGEHAIAHAAYVRLLGLVVGNAITSATPDLDGDENRD
jgi:hypothetical protein